jgi:hypothetical protein
MLRGILVLSLLLPAFLAAYEGSGATASTVTVQAGPIAVKTGDFFFKKRKDDIFILWDAFPYQNALAPFGPDALSLTAQGLVGGPGLARYPTATRFRVTVVEVKDRDSYGLPRWDTIKILLNLFYTVDKKKRVHPEMAPPG